MSEFERVRKRVHTAAAEARKAKRMARLQFAIVMAVLLVFWSVVAVVAATTFALAIGDDDGGAAPAPAATASAEPPATPTPLPPVALPARAVLVEGDLVVGDLDRDGASFFFNATCSEGLMSIATTRATVYAEVPCDRALTPAQVQRLGAQPVRIRTDGGKLLLEALFVGTFTFEPRRIWIVRP